MRGFKVYFWPQQRYNTTKVNPSDNKRGMFLFCNNSSKVKRDCTILSFELWDFYFFGQTIDLSVPSLTSGWSDVYDLFTQSAMIDFTCILS